MADPIFARQRQIIGTADDWADNNLVLGAGELALVRENDGTVRARVGDGSVAFSGAPYLSTSVAAFHYQGNADPGAPPPAGANPGDIYSASPGGTVDASWGPLAAGTVVEEGDFLIMTDDGSWIVQPGGVDLSGLVAEADLAAPGGSAMVGFLQAGAGAVPRTAQAKMRDFVNVRDFGALGGNAAADMAGFAAAFEHMRTTNIRHLVVPCAEYHFNDTLVVPDNLENVWVQGLVGYDGSRGPVNFNMFCVIKWTGAANIDKPVIRFNWPSGLVWSGVSINCDYKAGYGLQLTSLPLSSPNGGVKNTVERCSFHYAKRDGIIVGNEGPGTSGGTRQFFGNRFADLTMIGCARSAIHINETNADQQIFDSVMVYADDGGVHDCLNGFWFDHGGQYSELRNCQWGATGTTPGSASKYFAIRNEASDSSGGGAHGLQVTNFWSEAPMGGLYYGVTSTEDDKSFNFDHCACFVETGLAVFIDKGTSSEIPYTFNGCTFNGDIKMNSAQARKTELTLNGCRFKPGKGVRAADDVLTENGFAIMNTATGAFPRFASFAHGVLNNNLGAVWVETGMAKGERISIMFTQDATGSRLVDWNGSGQFSTLPPIPAPATAPGAKTTYTFLGDGTKYYLASCAKDVATLTHLSPPPFNPATATPTQVRARLASLVAQVELMLAELSTP